MVQKFNISHAKPLYDFNVILSINTITLRSFFFYYVEASVV